MESVFMDKAAKPTESNVKEKLDTTYQYWLQLKPHLNNTPKAPDEECYFPRKKYRWIF